MYSISGQSAGNAASSARASEVKEERRFCGTFSQPKKSATLFVSGLRKENQYLRNLNDKYFAHTRFC